MEHSVTVALMISALSAQPSAATTPTLEAALASAPMIVIGQIERIEDGPSPFATLRVDYAARGEAPKTLEVALSPSATRLPVIRAGDRLLAFLEPGGQTSRMKFLFEGTGRLSVFLRPDGLVVASRSGERLSLAPALCDRALNVKNFACAVRISRLFAEAGLPPMAGSAPRPATFRVRTRTCPPCSLESAVDALAGRGSVDCGSAMAALPSPPPIKCVRQAIEGKRPFHLLLELSSGADSATGFGFVFDGKEAVMLRVDTNTEGGEACSASVVKRRCKSLGFDPEGSRSWLNCEEPGPAERACSQADLRVEALGARRDVAALQCQYEGDDSTFALCELLSQGEEPTKLSPSRTGPDLICSELQPRKYLDCSAR